MKSYQPCEKVLELYPKTVICGWPVKTDGYVVRCDRHPMVKIWPDDSKIGG